MRNGSDRLVISVGLSPLPASGTRPLSGSGIGSVASERVGPGTGTSFPQGSATGSMGTAHADGDGRSRTGSIGVSQPDNTQLSLQGLAAALGVGQGEEPANRVAADLCVRQFLDAHASMDPLRGVKRNGTIGLAAIGRWLHANRMAASFTTLVLRGRQAHVFHVGGGRVYRMREGQIMRLTPDRPHAQRLGAGCRALGATDETPVDYAIEPVRIADRFLLCSHAVHAKLPDRCIRDLLAGEAPPADLAARVTDAAADIDALALVIDVLGLPDADPLGLRDEVQVLPIIPVPRAGAVVDRFRLETMLSDGQYSRVFRAVDETDGRVVITKFPKHSVSAEPALRQAFLREAWIAARVSSPLLAEVIEVPDDRRSALYTVMPYYEGETLEQRLRRRPRLSRTEGLAVARKLARAVATLHRHHVIHRDIKPDNVVLTADGGLRLLDLGVARLPNLQDLPGTDRPGTPSYMAPELLTGAEGDERTDLYALGVTIYRMFSGAYPYGEIEPFSRPRFTRPATKLATLRPDLPDWLDQAVQRAVAAKPEERQADVLELLHALDDPAGNPVSARPYRSMLDRNPVLFWQVIALLLAAGLIVVLALPGTG